MKNPAFRATARVLFLAAAWLALLPLLPAVEAPRTAVLDFVRTDSPGSYDAPATDFSRAVQARLLANNNYAWVERQEFDRIMREVDIGGLSRSDALSAVRLGQLLRADLLLRGQIAARAAGQGELTLEVIDLKRAEVLASRAVPLGMSANQRLRPGAPDIAAAATAAGAALDEARGRLEQMQTLRVIAPLYFKNISRTDRAGFIEAKVNEALAAAATPAMGVRVLRFPRAGEAGEESSLVLAGLTDTDPDAWQHVADAYVWGTINEQGADGVEFSEVAVTISLQVMNGSGAPREVRWEGAVKNLETGLQSVAAGVLEAAKAGTAAPGGTAGRKQLAEVLRKRADEVGQAINKERYQPRPGASSAIDFLKTTPGRQSSAYRLKLLEAACFFDPLNRSLQDARMDAAWASNPAEPLATLQGHWLLLADFEAQARRFERKPDGSADPAWTKRRTNLLRDLVKALDRAPWDARSRGRASAEDIQRQRRAVLARWSAAVVAANQPAGPGRTAIATEEDNQGWIEDLFDLSENSGDFVTARRLVDETWPALEKAAGRLLKSPGDEQHKQNFVNQLYSIYDAFGAFDQAAAMLDKAWKVGTAPLPVAGTKPPPPRRVDKPWQPVKQFQFKPPAGPAAPELPKLDASVHEVDLWPTMGYFEFDTRNGGGLQKKPSRQVDALAWQDGRLWIAESGSPLPPEEGPANPQGNTDFWRYDPALHTWEYFSAQLGAHSQIRELLPVGDELWLALDPDGVWRQDKSARVQRYKAEDGLMSPRMVAAQAGRTELFFLSGTAPDYSINRYSMASGKWTSLQVAAPAGLPAPPVPTGMILTGPGGPPGNPPQLAVSGEWLCTATSAVSFYNLTTNTWANLLTQLPSSLFPIPPRLPPEAAARYRSMIANAQQTGMPGTFSLITADEAGFWLGAPGRLLFVDPQAPAEAKTIVLPGLPMAAAHHGPWLWLAVNDNFGKPQLVLIDKRTATITGLVSLPAGFARKIIATDTRVWIGGAKLVEVTLREPRAAEGVPKDDLSDHPLLRAVWRGDVAQVKAVLATKPQVDEVTGSGWTALMAAAESGRTDLVEELLAAGANPNRLARNGRSPLHVALEADNLPAAELLLKHGAQPDLKASGRIRGLHGVRPLVEDMTLPPENKIIPPQPTGLKVTITAEGEIALTWQEHAAPDARYHVTRNSVVIADLPAGVARFVDAYPPWGEAKARYGVSARNVWGHWEFQAGEVPEVIATLPSQPADVVRIPETQAYGGDAILPQWVAAQPVLLEAAAAGRTETVKALLAHGADANVTDGTGQTPLIAAIRAGKSETARQLLAAGAKAGLMTQVSDSAASVAYQRHDDEAFFREIMAALSPAERSREASSLLIEAAGNGQIKDIELLRSLGGDLGGVTASGESALSLAIQRDQVETALWLLDQKAPLHRKIRGSLNAVETDGRMLQEAMRTNRPEIISRLLEAGCDGNFEIEGKPLVIVAAKQKSFATLRLLQEHGADLKRKDNEGKTLVNYLSPEEVRLFLPDEAATASWPPPRGKGYTPAGWTYPAAAADPAKRPLTEKLIAACQAGDLAAAKAALQAGAEIDQQGNDGRTALHHALMAQHPEVARWLVEEGASVNIVSRGGNTPLNFAIQNGEQLALVDFLLAAGADPNAFGSEGYPPVYAAVVTANGPALKRLLQTEAVVDLHGYNDQHELVSPLAMALAKGDEESVNLLLAAGANPRTQTCSFVQIERGTRKESGPTLLMYAAAGGRVTLLKQMIALGQDPRFKAAEGYDALAWAAGSGKKEAVEFLLPQAAQKGRALENALSNGHPEIAEILQRAGYQSP